MDVLAIVLGTVGAVVAVGLGTLLLWRIYTYLADRREYAKFERDLMLSSDVSTHNQLYESPITTYRVPDGVMESFKRGDN